MEALLAAFLPLAIKYGPEIYAVAQIDEIFSKVKPYDQLGIDPKAPVKPE